MFLAVRLIPGILVQKLGAPLERSMDGCEPAVPDRLLVSSEEALAAAPGA
jgi:hypothetical protein